MEAQGLKKLNIQPATKPADRPSTSNIEHRKRKRKKKDEECRTTQMLSFYKAVIIPEIIYAVEERAQMINEKVG
jgi:hypothetical protein